LGDGAGKRREVGVELHHSTRDGCIVVGITGQINLFTAPRIQRVLLKDLAERPYGIICDLRGVDGIDPVCAAVFSAVANHPSSDWPATSFLLCGARPAIAEVLGRAAVPHFLPLYDTLEQALDQIAARPPYLRDELPLAPTATAPAAARLYVRDVLQYWRLALPGQHVIDRAELLADELVTNAVVHARTALRLRLELRGDILHVAVHDASPRLLRLVPDDPEAEGGRGLRLVEQLATSWGVNRRPDGGKVVWCTLRLWPRPGPAATGP
jgi:anti-sigma regulatory factor (Ser/Thr protein kinase)/anti-anti-sigma regulatory factor